MIELTLDRPDRGTAEVAAGDDRVFIDETDRGGINGLTAVLEDGEWPAEVVVHLRLQGLESLEIAYGNLTIATGRSSNSNPDPPLMISVTDEQGQMQSASPSADIYYPVINHIADGFEITLPPHFFVEQHPSFSLRWIDFYR